MNELNEVPFPTLMFCTVVFEIWMLEYAYPIIPPAFNPDLTALFITVLYQITTKELQKPIKPPVYQADYIWLFCTVLFEMVQLSDVCEATKAEIYLPVFSFTSTLVIMFRILVQMQAFVIEPITPTQLSLSALCISALCILINILDYQI
ncbi:Hypothetical_protein [Hexamita inflata]|uniref:Hypothetical_protein n=1 Tax=Hexamita inflata TaxID=28002 RepID=A0ABP1KIK2_9EUKA